MKVVVEEYNPLWAEQYQKLERELKCTLKDVRYLSIEHVGSTSVPGLAAKPVIDIDIIATHEQLAAVTKALEEVGGYTNMGEWGIPERYAFRKEDPTPKHNLYVCIEGCLSLRNHLALREICRSNQEVRDTYGQFKLGLAHREWKDVNEYADAKDEMVLWVLKQAGMTKQETDQIHNSTVEMENNKAKAF